MASLTTHLRSPGDHGRLGFHPECPVCCGERLAGALPAQAVVGHRTQALLAAGVLALSTATPTAALAVEPDQEQEGTAAPEPVANGDVGSDPNFDPGGDSTDLPFDAAPAPDAQSPPAPDGEDDTGVLEQEPTTNDEAPVVDPGDGTGTPDAGQQQAPSTTDPASPRTPAAPPAPQLPSEPPPSPPVSGTQTATPAPLDTDAAPSDTDAAPSDTDAAARTEERKPATAREREPRTHAPAPSNTERATPAPQPGPVNVRGDTSAPSTVHSAQAPRTSPPAPVSDGRAAQRGDRFHVVQQGESLWSIARDLLGDGASAARIAREVNRLWELNGDRIGTGDRDLLMVGTRLELR